MESAETKTLKKTPAYHQPLRANEILISRKKPLVVYMKRVHELLFDKGQS